MVKLNSSIIFCAILLLFVVVVAEKMVVGVSLHPYYSFTTNIVKDLVDVKPLLKGNENVHGYRITPADIKRVLDFDVLVVNGVGHDEFAFNIIKAAGTDNTIKLIYANEDVALLPQSVRSNAVNSHTFVSISTSIQQIYTIAKRLGEIDPSNTTIYIKNASAYAMRLRKLKAEYMKRLTKLENVELRCATIHGGYSYLLQEFGFQVDAVIEPAHGLNPSASQLKNTIELIKSSNVKIVFSEKSFPSDFVETIRDETGVIIKAFSHLSSGEFSPDFFEKGMRYNLETLVSAAEEVANAK